MKIIVDENSFKKQIKEFEKALVFFYVEKGCSFCDQMKPVMDELSNEHDVLFYKCGDDLKSAKPDSITGKLVKAFPTFAAYQDGEFIASQSGGMSAEQVMMTFTPDLLPKKAKPLAQASMIELLTDEANLIDQIAPLRAHLAKVQKEMEKRKKQAMGKVDCCDSCSDGGECEGGCH
jgi:thiol-disulfide isomerase/thioredoxin